MGSLPERAAAFLAGDGHRVVQRHLRAHGLPITYAEDLVQETLVRCLTAEARGIDPEQLEAFVSELVRRSARDLLRGLRRRPEGHLATDDPVEELLGEGDDPADVVLTEADLDELASLVDAVRRRLARAASTSALDPPPVRWPCSPSLTARPSRRPTAPRRQEGRSGRGGRVGRPLLRRRRPVLPHGRGGGGRGDAPASLPWSPRAAPPSPRPPPTSAPSSATRWLTRSSSPSTSSAAGTRRRGLDRP